MGLLLHNQKLMLLPVEDAAGMFAVNSEKKAQKYRVVYSPEIAFKSAEPVVYLNPGSYPTVEIEGTEYTVVDDEDVLVEVVDAN